MRLCVVIEGQEGVTWDQWLALAQACETHGLEGLFCSDHYVSTVGGIGVEGRDALDAWTVLAGLAASTRRLRLGTLVSPATFRHPSVLAKAVTTVDHISGGRIELGIGAGWHEVEHRAYGIPFPDSATRSSLFAEQLEILVGQWTRAPFEFIGEHYRLESHTALPKPVQRPRPPIIVGGAARPGTVAPAVRLADEYNTYFASPETCRARAGRVREACEDSGRDPSTLRFSLMTGFAIGTDSQDLALRTRGIMKQEAATGEASAFLSQQAGTWVIGTVEEAVHRVNELAQVGVERLYLEHLDYENIDTIALIGSEIQPRVADM
jgi:F420-dependent oxidoreductase-like protein